MILRAMPKPIPGNCAECGKSAPLLPTLEPAFGRQGLTQDGRMRWLCARCRPKSAGAHERGDLLERLPRRERRAIQRQMPRNRLRSAPRR